MVRAGEVGGVLELVLTRLSEFPEKAAKIKNKIISAMVYPMIVMVMPTESPTRMMSMPLSSSKRAVG